MHHDVLHREAKPILGGINIHRCSNTLKVQGYGLKGTSALSRVVSLRSLGNHESTAYPLSQDIVRVLTNRYT